MKRPRPLPCVWFTALFLVLGTQVGSTATDAGGSGGYRTANFRYQFTSCGTTTTTTVRSGSQRYAAEFQSDLPGETTSLGLKAGVVITHVSTSSRSSSGRRSSSETRTGRVFLAPRFGFHLRYLDGTAGVGISFSDDETYPVLPVYHYEVRLGVIGYVSYYGRGEFLSLLQAETSAFHGVAILGGDLPFIHVAVGLSPHLYEPMTHYELGFTAPRHWPLRPTIRASITPQRDPTLTSFGVEAAIVGVIGQRRRWSKRCPPREPIDNPFRGEAPTR